MGAHKPIGSDLARGRPTPEEWGWIDPTIYITQARQQQARAMAEAIGAGWRGIRGGLAAASRLLRRYLWEPIARRSQRRHALSALAALDDRLLADIGLRRGDIELAVDGRLADPRLPPARPAATTANANRPPALPQHDGVTDLAA